MRECFMSRALRSSQHNETKNALYEPIHYKTVFYCILVPLQPLYKNSAIGSAKFR